MRIAEGPLARSACEPHDGRPDRPRRPTVRRRVPRRRGIVAATCSAHAGVRRADGRGRRVSVVFTPRGVLVVKLAALGVLGLSAGGLALLVWHARDLEHLGDPLAQPIPFSHKHHVGDDGIDCRYCHTTVETAARAGLPSTGVCLTCHDQLFRDQPMLGTLHRSMAQDRPIAWQRVHVLPDFVYFNHSVHVAKGVACIECHGRVDQMPLTWRASPLQMQWCLACHRDPAPHLRPRSEVFAMDAPRVAPAQAAELARAVHLESPRRMTDCSTCHR
jgi:hypothetical protein